MSYKRQTVIEEAFKLIYQKGYNGVGINEIVKAAVVPKGSFYYYFETKENLALETIHYYYNYFLKALRHILTHSNVAPLDRIAQLNQFYLDTYSDPWRMAHGCYGGNLAAEMGADNEAIRTLLDQYFKDNCNLIAQCLRDAQAAGELSDAVDADELAMFMVNAYQGALLQMQLSKKLDPLNNYVKTTDRLLASVAAPIESA